ncbi:hypothetical protein MLD38_032336 [Melastoma candidum]|uniref:Uncharacterized protein n=1 Tax=Melastoma candidum TaxID=119954 RepID=A0ACB9M4L0_9MYRT|nr:hypothetical protein MLD38_032336 [Melastoma candidum]
MGAKMSGDESSTAVTDIWKYVFGFADAAIVKCAIELGIPDVMMSLSGDSIKLSQLSLALGLGVPAPSLLRIMRFLANRGFFKLSVSHYRNDPAYSLTPLSKLLLKDGPGSLAPLILFESHPAMVAPWHNMAARVRGEDMPYEKANGEDIWEHMESNRELGRILDAGLACHARILVPALIEKWPELFDNVKTVVDVGGGNGSAMGEVTRMIPSIKAINFDLPHVVAEVPRQERVINTGGDMFKEVPKADAAFLMWVLHDWSDNDCIRILKNCSDAVPKDKGKVIIVEAVIEEDEEEGEGDGLRGVRLTLDMVMMSHTKEGKERTRREWEYLLKEAGFSTHTINPIPAILHSVIQAFP